jgi:hypothetical protein
MGELIIVCDNCDEELDVYCKNQVLKSDNYHDCYGESIGSVLDLSGSNPIKLRENISLRFKSHR